jgi:hypothetical protein
MPTPHSKSYIVDDTITHIQNKNQFERSTFLHHLRTYKYKFRRSQNQ